MSYNSTRRVLIIAGETSGDKLGAHLINAMTQQTDALSFFGFGGDLMQQAGADILMHSRELAIVGIIEVIKKFSIVRKAFKIIRHTLKHRTPDLVILIDYPGFNLRVAKLAKRANIPVFYYASPQIWAWKYNRIKVIRNCVDHMAVLFPFEEKLYHREQVPATFVGHPLAETAKVSMSRDQAYRHFQCDPNRPIVGLFPGSRGHEIDACLPVIAQAIPLIEAKLPGVQWLLPVAPHIDIKRLQLHLPPQVQLVHDHLYDAMQLCDAAIAVSGTITLELAYMQVPLTLLYKTHWLTYQIGKRVIQTPWIGLCNIIAQETVAEEWIQHQANAENLAHEVVQLVTPSAYRQQKQQQLQAIKQALGDGIDNTLSARLALQLITD